MREHDIRTVLGDQPSDADEAMRRAAEIRQCGVDGHGVAFGNETIWRFNDAEEAQEFIAGFTEHIAAVIAAKDAEIAALRDDLRIVQELNGAQSHEIERLCKALADAREACYGCRACELTRQRKASLKAVEEHAAREKGGA